MYFVYMVYCEGDTLYTGVAQDICRRMRQHTDRGKGTALRLEYRIKQLTRTEKERLIHEDTAFSQLLPQLEVSRYRRRPGITLEMCLEGKIDA